MKKKRNDAWLYHFKLWRKMLMFMKLLSLLLFGVCMSVHANVLAQDARVSVDLKEVTLTSVLEELSRQSRCDFFYNYALVATKGKVSVRAEDKELRLVLDELLQGVGLTYSFDGNVVVIKERMEDDKPQKKSLRIKGKVTDEGNFPLPGVTVKIKNSALGAASDKDGRFSFMIPNMKDFTLVFSFVGMETQEVKYSGQDSIHVVLKEIPQQMEEVVVTGYQVIDKREVTSSISTIGAEELEKMNVLTVDQMLEGKAPGLMITNLSATPGAAAKVRVRSGGTFTGSREPLWVVDGIPYEDPVPLSAAEINSFDRVNLIGNALTGLNPQDIESINILKDASATAIYGTRAANGVIVITTKRGTKGRARLTYSGSAGVVDRPRYKNFNLMNSRERIDVSREIYQRNLAYPDDVVSFVGYEGALREYLLGNTTYSQFQGEVSYLESLNTDWFGELYRPSFTMSHSLNVSGGTEHTRYYFSVGYNQNDGAEKGVTLNRLTARSNLDVELRKNLKFQLGMSGSVQEARYNHSSVNAFNEAYYTSRAVPVRERDGDLYYVQKKMGIFSGNVMYGKYNVLNEMKNSEKNIDNKDFNINASLNWDIVRGVKFMGQASYRNTTNINEEWIMADTYYVAKLRSYDGVEDAIADAINKNSTVPFGGLYSTGHTSQRSYTMKLQLNLNKVMWEQHAFNLNLGYEVNSVKYLGVSGYTTPGYNHLQGRSFIELPRYQINTDGSLKEFGYTAMLQWLTGQGNLDIYPTITDRLSNKLSYYLIFNYSYVNRYVLNFNMRSDGSNTFGQYERYKFRPTWSVSARWNVHSEKFMPKDGVMDELALRVSYGFRGTSPSALPYMVIRNYQYDSNFGENLSQLSSFPNANLSWERTSTLNIGLNHSWFNGRLSGAFDFAYSKGEDLLLSRPVSLVNGKATQLYNGGKKEDYSYEMNLRGELIKTKDLGWSLSGNISHTKETILAGQVLEDASLNVNDYLGGSIYMTGFPVDAFYSYQFDRLDEEGLPTFKNLDAGGASVAEYFSNVLTYSGRRTPTVYGGFGTEFRYKNFTLGANFSFKFGQSVRRLALYGGTQNMPMPHENMSSEFNKRWRQPGDEAHCVIPGLSNRKLSVGTSSNYEIQVAYRDIVPTGSNNGWYMYDKSDLRVVKGDHIRWQSLTLGYNVPRSVLKFAGISSCRLSAQVSNLGVLVFDRKLKGQDPEQVQGIGMPSLPSYNFSLNISF